MPAKLLHSCPTLCDPIDCSPPGFSVHGILQVREWVAMPSSRGIFPTQGSNSGLPHCRQILHHLSHHGSPGQFLLPGKIPLHFFRTPKGLMRGLGFQSSMPYWGAGGQGCGDGHHCPSQPMPAGVAQGAQAPLRPAQLCPAHRSFRLLHAPGGPTLAHTCF